MSDPIGDLKAAGFSDDEIGTWATEKRSTLSQAGFSGQEIDSYLGGSQPPVRASAGLIDRLMQGTSIGRVIGAIGKGAAEGFGPSPLGFSPENDKWMRDVGLFDSQERKGLGNDLTRGIRFANEAVINPAVKAGDFLFRVPGALTGGIAGGVGQAVQEPGSTILGTPTPAAMSEGMAHRLVRDVKSLGDISLLLSGSQPLTRVQRGPTGEVFDQPIGNLPKPEHFGQAAKSLVEPSLWAYHGSPHDFEAFDLSKVGTGEGAQAYGHGIYAAENPGVAADYRRRLAPGDDSRVRPDEQATAAHIAQWDQLVEERRAAAGPDLRGDTSSVDAKMDALHQRMIDETVERSPSLKEGVLYKVRVLADKEHFLDWDKPLSEQSQKIRSALEPFREAVAKDLANNPTLSAPETVGQVISGSHNLGLRPEEVLRKAGIPGIKYLDSGSRDAAEGTRNFVVFDDKLIQITHKNGKPILSDPPPYVEDKIRRLWDEYGIHPAEVAHDAANDPVIKQDILSSTDKLPDAYTGGSGGKPPPPPPPAPPSEPGGYNDAQQKVLSKISVGETEPGRKLSWNKFYTEAIDSLAPIEQAVRKATDNEALPVAEDAYKLARLTRGVFGKANHFLNYGTYEFNTYANNGPSLKAILEPVRDDLNGLRAYLASKRAIEIEATERKSGLDLEAAQAVVGKGRSTYEHVATQLQTYQNNLAKYLKDSGVLSQAGYDAMIAANKDYVPFYRVMRVLGETHAENAGKGFGPGNPLKSLEGSERDIVDPLESVIKNTFAYISVAERNAVGIKLIDTLKDNAKDLIHEVREAKKNDIDPSVAEYLTDHGVEKPPQDLVTMLRSSVPEPTGQIGAFRNGVKETYKVSDPELLSAFRGLNQDSVNTLIKVLAVPAKMLRAGATLTPDFVARNLTRDFVTAFVNSKGIIFSPLDTLSGLKSALTKDESFQAWLKSGGANSALVSLDRQYLQESLQKLNSDTGLMTRTWNVVTSPLSGLRAISELAENATRLGEFKKVLGKEPSKAAVQEAGFASREVTIDFARIGASMRAYNMITAFSNAQIQGVDRLARAFRDNPASTSLRIATGITLPSILLWYANHDDPRYQELPSWQKDLFWIVMTKDHIFRIPKPFEIGVIFGSGAERILDAVIGKKPDAFKKFANSLASALLPGMTPTIAQPLVEQFANRSTFTDRTLIPADMEKHLPEYQYTPYTTELSKALGRIISSFPGMRAESLEQEGAGAIARAVTSPILIENYIRGWTGGLGSYALQAADASLRKSGVLPDPIKPAATLADIPFVKAFVVRYPSASAQSIQDFYDDYQKNKRFYDTWQAMAKEGDTVAMQRIQDAGGPRMFVQLDEIKKTLTEHSHLVRDVYKNPQMPADQKRQLIDQLYYSMIKIGQFGKEAMRQVDGALATKH